MKLSRPLFALAVLIFLLIVVGGLVRNLGAGLSCPDWPLCQGRFIPQFDLRVFAEYFHRLFAATVSLLTLGLSGYILYEPNLRKLLGKPATFALTLLMSQVVLGGLTVLKLLQSEIVTLHLATGTLFFGTVLYMALRAKDSETPQKPATNRNLLLFAYVSLALVYVQIILGGVVSSHYAGLACPDFPTCLGEWWPGLSGQVGIQWLHRLGATTVFLVVLAFAFNLKRLIYKNQWPAILNILTSLVILALLTQVSLGIANVLWRLPVKLSVAHLAVAEALLALVLILTYEIRYLQLR